LPAGIGGFAPLPGKLDLDPVIALGGDDLIGEADDQGGLRPGGRFGQQGGDDRG
jgi:hypothetical protein